MTVEPNTARLPIFTFPVFPANSLENCSSATALVTSLSPLHRIAMYVAQLFHILALARDILTVIVPAASQTHLLLRSTKTNPALLRKRWGTLAYSEDRKNREGWATRPIKFARFPVRTAPWHDLSGKIARTERRF